MKDFDFLSQSQQNKNAENERNVTNFNIDTDKRAEVTAFIKEITPIGEVLIEFNTSMNDKFNLSMINSTSVEIDLVLSIDRIDDTTFNQSKLQFEWHPVSFEDKLLKLQILFEYPLLISPNVEQDLLKIKFINLNLFTAASNGKELGIRWRRLYSDVKRQIEPSKFNLDLLANAQQTEAFMQNIFIFCIFMNLFMPGRAIGYFLAMLRALQMILHLPLINVVFPGNLQMLFKIMIPIVMFDVFGQDLTTQIQLQFEYDEQGELSKNLLSQLVDLGYESDNAILNLGSVIVFLITYVMEVFAFIFLAIALAAITLKWAKPKKMLKMYNWLYKKLFFAEILTIFIEAYLEFIISGTLNVKSSFMHEKGELHDDEAEDDILAVLSLNTAWVCLLLCLIVIPIVFIWVLFQDKERYKE